ncbi:MAG: type II toxin-antitoxin system RelB/DinJ family antitoxin [Clostridiales bacterium]
MAQINIRIDDDLKNRAEDLFEELGMNMSTAFNIFLRQTLRQGGIPFAITTKAYPYEKIEEVVRNVAAIMSFEGMDLTEQDKNNMRLVLTGEATGNEVIADIIKPHKSSAAGII